MPAINLREMRRQVELDGAEKTEKHLAEALNEGHLKPEDFSLRGLFETFVTNAQGDAVGRDVLEECCDPRGPKKNLALQESAGTVSTAMFANITNRLLSSKMLDGYKSEAFKMSALIPTIPTSLDGERIAGISELGDQTQIVAEAAQYPLIGVGEDYIDTPPTVKRGAIVPVTKEAIFFDRTGMVLMRAGKVGTALGINKEKRAIDCVIDQNTTAHRYKWRGTVYDTYVSSGGHGAVNLKTSNGLTSSANIAAAELLLAAMVDPNTGEPFVTVADTIIVAPELEATAKAILTAIHGEVAVGGYAVSGNLASFRHPNQVGNTTTSGNYQVVTSRYLPGRLATDTTWYIGSPKTAFAYMENWSITTTQAPPNSEEEFNRDIAYRFKASERGAYVTLEPRVMVENTVA